MLNEQKVKKLSKDQKTELDMLLKEYEEAVNATRTRRLGGPGKEILNRHHEATRNLAEFITRHNLRKH